MRYSIRLVSRLLAVAVVSAAALVVPEPAMAVTVPETMADRRPVQVGPVESAFPIDHLGVIWDTDDRSDGHPHEEAGSEPHGAVRFRTDGRWGPWVPLVKEGAEADGQWASGLVAGGDAEAYQVRGIPAGARSARAVVINTTDGPLVKVGERRPGAGALESTQCRSRADWGADEKLRSSSRTYYDVQALTVHHTVTANNDSDPAATVRAIYRYHTADQGWSDIGYQFLVDEKGVVYEGRWSGTTSRSCLTGGGDGSDFAHESGGDRVVTGAHAGGFNSGNVGVALLGRFTSETGIGGAPTPAAVQGLETLLTELSTRHALDPTGTVSYVNPVNGDRRTVATISGHRDWNATECPGDRLYPQLPTIRTEVEAAMDGSGGEGEPVDTAPTNVAVTSPAGGATVGDILTLTATATDDQGIAGVDFLVDGTRIGTGAAGAAEGTWSLQWDSRSVSDAPHALTATATDTLGQSTTSPPVSVTVKNSAVPPPTSLAVSGVSPATLGVGQTDVVLSGSGFVSGAAVTFENGKGHTPTVRVTSVDPHSIKATVTVQAKGPQGSWTLRVTMPDGSSATAPEPVLVKR